MYKLVHTQNQKQLSTYITHTIQVSPQSQACSKSRERYHNSCNPKNKNKTRHKIKKFCLFENFQYFWIFFFNKKQPKKQNNRKTKTKHVHKQLKELNQG